MDFLCLLIGRYVIVTAYLFIVQRIHVLTMMVMMVVTRIVTIISLFLQVKIN